MTARIIPPFVDAPRRPRRRRSARPKPVQLDLFRREGEKAHLWEENGARFYHCRKCGALEGSRAGKRECNVPF